MKNTMLRHIIDGQVVSNTLCLNAYAFAYILARRQQEWDPFYTRTNLPLSQVLRHLP